jgi:hypothetical protein
VSLLAPGISHPVAPVGVGMGKVAGLSRSRFFVMIYWYFCYDRR